MDQDSAGAAGTPGVDGGHGGDAQHPTEGGVVDGACPSCIYPIEAGAPCRDENARACAGPAQIARLTCENGTWRLSDVCLDGENCDQRSGQCEPVLAECAGKVPGTSICAPQGPVRVLTCGPDLVNTTESEQCVGRCVQGAASAACAPASCGDHRLQALEVCDDGNVDDTDSCTTLCQEARCGDGFVLAGTEDCDDANNDDADSCTEDCKEAYCGDGFTWSIAEDCDDANDSNTDDCVDDCVEARCGDGYLREGVEDCDDGNQNNGDDCSATCEIETRLLSLVSRGRFNCALNFNGVVKCWGENTHGELGVGSTDPHGSGPNQMGHSLPPVRLPAGKRAVAITAGFLHACAQLDDATVTCWGRNEEGALGLGHSEDRGDSSAPLELVNLGTGRVALKIAAGRSHTCALLDDHTMKCWGRNDYGQLGQDSTESLGDAPGEMGDQLPPIHFAGGATVDDFVVGTYHTCAFLSDDSVRCWGRNDSGQLGMGDPFHRGDSFGEMANAIVALDLGAPPRTLVLGHSHGCAQLADASFKCWGHNASGQLGLGDQNNRGDQLNELGTLLPAVNLGTGRVVSTYAVGGGHVCGVLDNLDLKCFGSGGYGRLGYGDGSSRGAFAGTMGDALGSVNLGTGLYATQLAAGYQHVCALLNDNTVKCWGNNAYGQLGLGDNGDRGSSPNHMGDNLLRVDLKFGPPATAQ